jgi:hypothetical protein
VEIGWIAPPPLRIVAAAEATTMPTTTLLGPLLVSIFCLSQALRDVYFGHVFQQVDFFLVILLAFGPASIAFAAISLIRTPEAVARLAGELPTVVAMNVTTALAWSCYFFALSRLEPAVVNTVHSGVGPLTVLALAACGVELAGPSGLRRGERWGHIGIALALAALWWVTLSGRSGLPGSDVLTNLGGLALVTVSGASITLSLLYAKRLHDRGIGAAAVTAVRYPLLIALVGGTLAAGGQVGEIGDPATLILAANALIVAPLFVLQVGIALTPPLTAHVVRSLGPAFVFALEPLDGRLAYSSATFACILAYSVCSIAGNLAHGWGRSARIG